MASKIALSQYLSEFSSKTPDRDYVSILKDMIHDSVEENGVYYDLDDIEQAVKVVYPVIYNIIFNINFKFGRDDNEIEDLISYLVTRLA